MRPESERAPSAKIYEQKIWRPVAALLLSFCAGLVYDEPSSSVNTQAETDYQTSLQLDIKNPTIESRSRQSLFGSFSIAKLPADQDQELSPQIPNEVPKSRITGYYCQYVPGYPVGDGGGWCNPTASGKSPEPGDAACGQKWELGTTLYIEGWGKVLCADRGNLAVDQVDIFFPTNKDLAESNKPQWAEVSLTDQP